MDYKELISQLQKPIMVDGAYVVDHLRREAAETIASLIERAAIAEYELAQKNEYYDQMVDALAGLSSKELEETKEKLRVTMERLAQVEQERDEYKELFFSYKHICGGLSPEEVRSIVHGIQETNLSYPDTLICSICNSNNDMYEFTIESAEKTEIVENKINKIKICPLCQGRGQLPTWFYGIGNCSIEDARNDKFPVICHVCLGKSIILSNEKTGEEWA